MRLLRFKFKNIFSLGEGEINLSNRGLILVTGHSLDEGSSNGSGKSSVANKGILWTLYGATAGGLRADDVINRHGGTKSGSGEIEFEGFDSHRYIVKRSRPAKLLFFKDGSEITTKKATETQKLIDQALGLDFNTFIQTYMFGQGRLSSYASLPPAEQKAILEQILPIYQLDVWSEYAKKCRLDLNQTYSTVEAEQSKLKYALESRLRDLESMRRQNASWDLERNTRIGQQLETLEAYKKWIFDINQKVDSLKKELDGYSNVGKELEEATCQADQYRDSIEKLRSKMHTVDLRKAQWQHNRTIELKSIVSINDDICPTCKRPHVDNSTVELIVNQNVEHQRLADECVDYIDKCNYLLSATKKESDIARDGLAVVIKRKSELEHIVIKISDIKEEIGRIDCHDDRTEELTKKIETTASEANPYAEFVLQYKIDIDNIKSKIRPMDDMLDTLTNEKSYVHYWEKLYGHDAKMKLFENVCHFLDTQTEHYLKELKNSQLKVQFSTIKTLASGEVKEDFNVRVYSEKGGEGFETLSGGEQQIVSFAISKALSDLAKAQTSGSSDFEILDEPFSMLDPRNCESLIEFLGKQHGTIMLISNDENLMNLVPERLHVEKYKGVTSVAYGG